jgi:cysteine-rich repeat protein
VVDSNTAPCSDDDACTVNDACVDSQCVAGAPLTCNDGEDCTTDTCDPAEGCEHAPLSPCCGDGVIEGAEECDDANEDDGDDCANDCTVPLEDDWRIGTWAGVPVYGEKNCASGDYYCQAQSACEQATGASCSWQSYTCSTYNDQNGSFYPTSNPLGRSVSTSGSSSLNWTVTSACSAQFTNSLCNHGDGNVYGNLCCCSCGGLNTDWNEGNQNCGHGIWEPY